jgi:hypothetical protein
MGAATMHLFFQLVSRRYERDIALILILLILENEAGFAGASTSEAALQRRTPPARMARTREPARMNGSSCGLKRMRVGAPPRAPATGLFFGNTLPGTQKLEYSGILPR